MARNLGRSIGLWIVVVVCLVVFAYVVMLFALNAPRGVDFRIYPGQDEVPGYWVVIVLLGVGILIPPCVRHLYRAVKRLRAERTAAEQQRKTE
jgi:uncharacterized integral membrane protein